MCDLLGSCIAPSHAVVKFMDVYQRSYCRPIETLVDIFQEYPDEIEYIFKPSCVPLMRCGGCCNDEGLECVPTEEFNITMQVGTCGEWGWGTLERRSQTCLAQLLPPESVRWRCGGVLPLWGKKAFISLSRFPTSPDHPLLFPDLCPLGSGGR